MGIIINVITARIILLYLGNCDVAFQNPSNFTQN